MLSFRVGDMLTAMDSSEVQTCYSALDHAAAATYLAGYGALKDLLVLVVNELDKMEDGTSGKDLPAEKFGEALGAAVQAYGDLENESCAAEGASEKPFFTSLHECAPGSGRSLWKSSCCDIGQTLKWLDAKTDSALMALSRGDGTPGPSDFAKGFRLLIQGMLAAATGTPVEI